MNKDFDYMGFALAEAAKAASVGEVPVGAVIVRGDELISTGFNRTEADNNPTAHAEMLAIKDACGVLGGWRLTGSTLYVTLEPCTMCIGAAILARIDKIVFGCSDPKSGAAGSLFNIASDSRLNHQVEIVPGVREIECGNILKDFFKSLRIKKKAH